MNLCFKLSVPDKNHIVICNSCSVKMRYILVGAGAFGASTALHLKESHEDSEVILMDRTPFPCPSAAGHDLNKVVRAEYNDTLYMELALEAMQQWKSSPYDWSRNAKG